MKKSLVAICCALPLLIVFAKAPAQDYSDCAGLKRQIDQLGQSTEDMSSPIAPLGSSNRSVRDPGSQVGSMAETRNQYVKMYNALCTGSTSAHTPANSNVASIFGFALNLLNNIANEERRQAQEVAERNARAAEVIRHMEQTIAPYMARGDAYMARGLCEQAWGEYQQAIILLALPSVLPKLHAAERCAAAARPNLADQTAPTSTVGRRLAERLRGTPEPTEAPPENSPTDDKLNVLQQTLRASGYAVCPTAEQADAICSGKTSEPSLAAFRTNPKGICSLMLTAGTTGTLECERQRLRADLDFRLRLHDAENATDIAIRKYNCETRKNLSDCQDSTVSH